jgi:transcriptional regulator with XRE-family HTH domain
MTTIEPIYNRIGLNIRNARNVAGLTQEELASAVGLSRTSINNIEKARQKLLVHTLFEIAEACQTTPESLLAKEGGRANVPTDLEQWVKRLEKSAVRK